MIIFANHSSRSNCWRDWKRLLRRSRATASTANAAEPLDAFSFGSVVVNFRNTEVLNNGKLVELSAREFQLLSYFIAQRGATLSAITCCAKFGAMKPEC